MRHIGNVHGSNLFVAALALGLAACSSESGIARDGNGGSVSAGGAMAGGATSSSGGATAGAGGAGTPGGSTASGGASTGGGAASTGTGGASPGAGGVAPGSGGATPGSSGAGPASGGAAAAGGAGGDSGGAPGGTLPPVDKVDVNGPFAVTIDEGAGPNEGWIAHPTELGKNGLKHPVFSWGCGGGSQPSQYKDHLTRIASHGFVMEAHVSTGEAVDHKAIVDWFVEQNGTASSPYHQKLDITKMAAGGHSMGSIATFAFVKTDTRMVTSIHVAGGSFDGNGFQALKNPTLMIGGSGDTLAGTNVQRDYDNTTVPVFLTVIQGSDHIYAARDGLPPLVAWLRWHLGGEAQRKSMFVGPSCDFCGGKWMGKSKNW